MAQEASKGDQTCPGALGLSSGAPICATACVSPATDSSGHFEGYRTPTGSLIVPMSAQESYSETPDGGTMTPAHILTLRISHSSWVLTRGDRTYKWHLTMPGIPLQDQGGSSVTSAGPSAATVHANTWTAGLEAITHPLASFPSYVLAAHAVGQYAEEHGLPLKFVKQHPPNKIVHCEIQKKVADGAHVGVEDCAFKLELLPDPAQKAGWQVHLRNGQHTTHEMPVLVRYKPKMRTCLRCRRWGHNAKTCPFAEAGKNAEPTPSSFQGHTTVDTLQSERALVPSVENRGAGPSSNALSHATLAMSNGAPSTAEASAPAAAALFSSGAGASAAGEAGMNGPHCPTPHYLQALRTMLAQALARASGDAIGGCSSTATAHANYDTASAAPGLSAPSAHFAEQGPTPSYEDVSGGSPSNVPPLIGIETTTSAPAASMPEISAPRPAELQINEQHLGPLQLEEQSADAAMLSSSQEEPSAGLPASQDDGLPGEPIDLVSPEPEPYEGDYDHPIDLCASPEVGVA